MSLLTALRTTQIDLLDVFAEIPVETVKDPSNLFTDMILAVFIAILGGLLAQIVWGPDAGAAGRWIVTLSGVACGSLFLLACGTVLNEGYVERMVPADAEIVRTTMKASVQDSYNLELISTPLLGKDPEERSAPTKSRFLTPSGDNLTALLAFDQATGRAIITDDTREEHLKPKDTK